MEEHRHSLLKWQFSWIFHIVTVLVYPSYLFILWLIPFLALVALPTFHQTACTACAPGSTTHAATGFSGKCEPCYAGMYTDKWATVVVRFFLARFVRAK
jgi:hypothetical protein